MKSNSASDDELEGTPFWYPISKVREVVKNYLKKDPKNKKLLGLLDGLEEEEQAESSIVNGDFIALSLSGDGQSSPSEGRRLLSKLFSNLDRFQVGLSVSQILSLVEPGKVKKCETLRSSFKRLKVKALFRIPGDTPKAKPVYRYIPLTIRPSQILVAGMGVFADEMIPEGATGFYRGVLKTIKTYNEYYSWTLYTWDQRGDVVEDEPLEKEDKEARKRVLRKTWWGEGFVPSFMEGGNERGRGDGTVPKKKKEEILDLGLVCFRDATEGWGSGTGNWAKYVNTSNHDSKNNMSYRQKYDVIEYVANRTVEPGEELFINYGDGYFESHLGFESEDYYSDVGCGLSPKHQVVRPALPTKLLKELSSFPTSVPGCCVWSCEVCGILIRCDKCGKCRVDVSTVEGTVDCICYVCSPPSPKRKVATTKSKKTRSR
jgi:hypothetical protein